MLWYSYRGSEMLDQKILKPNKCKIRAALASTDQEVDSPVWLA